MKGVRRGIAWRPFCICSEVQRVYPSVYRSRVRREHPACSNNSTTWCSSGDVLAGVTLARHDAGLFQTYRFTVAQDLNNGTLVEVLRDFGGCTRPFILFIRMRDTCRRE